MARYTGLSKAFIDCLDLRVPLGPFSTELLRDQHLMTSRLDSRFAGYQLDAGANNTSFDYSNANIENCFLTAFEAYVRNDLNYKNDSLYYVSGNAPPWSGEYNTVVNLETGFSKNPHMKLFVGMGYYDFACPFYPMEWTIAHLKVSDEIKKNNIFARLLRGRPHGLHRPAVGRQIPRGPGEVRAVLTAEVRSIELPCQPRAGGES